MPEGPKAKDLLGYYGCLAGRQPDRERLTAVLTQVGLQEVAERPVSTFSNGMRQRLALGASLNGWVTRHLRHGIGQPGIIQLQLGSVPSGWMLLYGPGGNPPCRHGGLPAPELAGWPPTPCNRRGPAGV